MATKSYAKTALTKISGLDGPEEQVSKFNVDNKLTVCSCPAIRYTRSSAMQPIDVMHLVLL